jgi:HEAT repeat protein
LSAKQDICRILWQIGSAQSAPALKQLLTQPETVDIACYAVANTPVPELGQAVRDALAGSTGLVAVSLLNLLGQRRDAGAVSLIVPFLQNNSSLVTAAAAKALGKIGGASAASALDTFRRSTGSGQRGIADNAYLRAVEGLDAPDAIRVWRGLVAGKDQSDLVRREALLRLSEHDPQAAWPWLLAALREEEPALRPATGQALRNLGDPSLQERATTIQRDKSNAASSLAPSDGERVGVRGSFLPTSDAVYSLPGLPAASQVVVVEALGAVIPLERLAALVRQPGIRASTLRVLGSRPEPEAATMLLVEALSVDSIPDRPTIFGLLKAVPGQAATEVMLKALPTAPSPWLPELVKVLLARGGKVPLAPLLERARAGEPSARVQAIHSLGLVATAADRGDLVDLLTSSDNSEIHNTVEQALAEVVSRFSSADLQVDWLLAGLNSAQRPQDRQTWLRLLAGTGTSAALRTVTTQLREGHPEDREAALRALSQWPNEAGLAPLLELTSERLTDTERTLVLRGAVRLLQEAQTTGRSKSDSFRQLLPLAGDPANRKLWLSGLAQVNEPAALELLLPILDDPAVRPEASLAAFAIASNLGPGDDALVNTTMDRIVAVAPSADLRTQAEARLRPARPPLPDVFLDTLQPLKAVSGNDSGKGKPQINRNCIGQPLKLEGVIYARGLGEHAPAELNYEIKPGYKRFVCVVGLDDQVARYHDERGSIVVKVLADDRLVAQTRILRGGGATANVDTLVPPGARALRLIVEDAGDGVDFDDADFVNAGFLVR